MCLDTLYKLTVTDSMITTDIVTATFSYELGVTNFQFIICLGDDVNQYYFFNTKKPPNTVTFLV